MDENKWRRFAIELAWLLKKHRGGLMPDDVLGLCKFEAALDGVDFERMFADVKTT